MPVKWNGWPNDFVSENLIYLIYTFIFPPPLCLFLFQYFTGNREQNTVVVHRFYPPIKARFVQVRPWGWYGHISMRVEFYGCVEGVTNLYFVSVKLWT